MERKAWRNTFQPLFNGFASTWNVTRGVVETEGVGLMDTGLPCVIVTHTGNKPGAIRKTPLMRVKDGDNYVLVGSQGGAPKNPVWVYNLRANPAVEIRDATEVSTIKGARDKGRRGARQNLGSRGGSISAIR
ncbi:MAG: hypothetical protein CM1200mP9_03660 [Gammaproteobacteria bacterium]|nr:MAG: hypothetical protein CM1200mP9_03660 [Gammaproteobacteria bacterium]